MTAGPCPVAVVVVTWNSMKYIGDCLESLVALDSPPAEVVVVAEALQGLRGLGPYRRHAQLAQGSYLQAARRIALAEKAHPIDAGEDHPVELLQTRQGLVQCLPIRGRNDLDGGAQNRLRTQTPQLIHPGGSLGARSGNHDASPG